MDIDKLAGITAQEFDTVHDNMGKMDTKIDQLVEGQKRILQVILDLPPKKTFEKLTHKVEDIDQRVSILEHKTA